MRKGIKTIWAAFSFAFTGFLKRKFLFIFLFVLGAANAQSLQHPVIWTTTADKAEIAAKVENYTWAANIISKAKAAVDDKVNTHITNPSAILNTIPACETNDHLSETEASSNNAKHAKVLNYASYAGMIYYVTGEEKYAQFAADILWDYIEELSPRTPATTAFSGSHFYDPRAGYLHFAIAYDFMVNYLKASGTKVFQKSSGTKVAFDNVKAQKAVHNIAMNALQEHAGSDTRIGQRVSNHPILRAPGVLFSILCVEEDTERERMFNVFWNTGTKNQNSFTKTILPMFGEQGIWPESVSYGFMPNITLVLNLVDRLKPEMNLMADKMNILDGNFLFDNLRHPNRRFVRYGDSHRDNDGTGALYRYTLDLAKRRGFTEYEQRAKVALRQGYTAQGGYDPAVPVTTFDNVKAFEQLFWGVDIPETIEGEIDFQKPTVIVKHAGVALQRNYVEEENIKYGLCGIIGGAHYVHSHCSGITMELYGADYIMAANAGLPNSLAERSWPVHTEYFWRHAGNNTVIVNGTSHGIQSGAWKSNSGLWKNTPVREAAEPKHLEDPVNSNFSFATQFLDDEVNNCKQQRTLSTIRTSETSGYYFDMFRSKSNGSNNFHDYVYHNLGDETHIFDSNGNEQSVSATARYQTDIGDTYKSPGWRFFEDTKVTEPSDETTHIRFDVNETNTYMNLFVPAGVTREYTKALGPATREAKGGYEDKKTQIMAIRQQGEAWNKPFVNIFEPSLSTNSSVKSVEHLYRGEVIVGAKVTSQINNATIVDYVICQEDDDKTVTLPEMGLTFEGRFAVVRNERDMEKAQTTLYIGEGNSLAFGNHVLEAGADKKGTLVVEGEIDLSRVLGFKNLANNTIVEKGSNLLVEAIVGSAFTEVSLWSGDTNLGTLTSEPYVWSGHSILTDMNDASYTFKLVAKDSSNAIVEKTITIKTNQPSVNGFSGEGQYKFYNIGKSKWMGYDVATDDALVTDAGDAAINKFNVKANGDQFNIYTGDDQKVVIINSSTGFTSMLATPTTQVLASGDALFRFEETSFGSDLYFMVSSAIDSDTGKGYKLNVKSNGTDIGRGTSEFSSYQWQLTRLGDLVSVNEVLKEKEALSIYPNPAKDMIYFKGAKLQNARVFSLSGQLIRNSAVYHNQMNVSELKGGIYVLQLEDATGKLYIKKLVI